MKFVKPYRSLTDRIWPRIHRVRRSDRYVLHEIRKRASKFTECSDAKLKEKSLDLRRHLQANEKSTLEFQSVVEAFALATEALRRTSGKIYYDCQLQAGLALATGAIAEMQTGEGKTITCGLPAILYGLTGKGVHVATTNAYLAQRDFEELRPVFSVLGITTGLLSDQQDLTEKQSAYRQDVTYGTGYEFGFDFLRDQLALREQVPLPLGTRFLSRLRGMRESCVASMQRPLSFAIIDEADSVLIDEATTPLVLSGRGNSVADPSVYREAMVVARKLSDPKHYRVDWTKKTIELTDEGWKLAHQSLPTNVQKKLHRPWSTYIDQALRASILLAKDVDYVVVDDQVVIVDQNTGRLHE